MPNPLPGNHVHRPNHCSIHRPSEPYPMTQSRERISSQCTPTPHPRTVDRPTRSQTSVAQNATVALLTLVRDVLTPVHISSVCIELMPVSPSTRSEQGHTEGSFLRGGGMLEKSNSRSQTDLSCYRVLIRGKVMGGRDQV